MKRISVTATIARNSELLVGSWAGSRDCNRMAGVSFLRRIILAAAAAASAACAAQPQASAEAQALRRRQARRCGRRPRALRLHVCARAEPADADPRRDGADRHGHAHRQRRRADRRLAGSQAVGNALAAPEGARVVEANGRWVTPGLIDVHSHMGVYASPGTDALDDGNEIDGPGDVERLGRAQRVAAGPGFRGGARRAASPRCRSCRAPRT